MFLLIHFAQAQTKLQQTVRRPPALGITLVALQEILCCLAEIALRLITRPCYCELLASNELYQKLNALQFKE